MVKTVLLACWAMREWNVIICDIVEEMDLVLVQHQASSNRVNWSITPALIEEATCLI